MNPRLRLVLLIALAAAVAQVVATGGDDPAGAGAALTAAAPAAAPAAAREETLVERFRQAVQDRLAGPVPDGQAVDLFQAKSWYVPPPPPPPPKPRPPPPPTAPPLPYTYLGQYLEPGGRQVIFLVKGDRLYTTTPGEVIDNTYRVEGIQSGQLGLIYLPLNIKQTMFVGEPS